MQTGPFVSGFIRDDSGILGAECSERGNESIKSFVYEMGCRLGDKTKGRLIITPMCATLSAT